MELVYTKQNGLDYEFACYPADMNLAEIMQGLSGFGCVTRVVKILDDDYPLGLIKVRFVNNPIIEKTIREVEIFNIEPFITQHSLTYSFTVSQQSYSSDFIAPPVYYNCEGTVDLGEEERVEASGTTNEKTYIFFIPTPSCTVQSLFEQFKKMEKLDYIYPSKTRTGGKRFGYARYFQIKSAELALNTFELRKYCCKQGKEPQITRKEEIDPYFKKFIICNHCHFYIHTKTRRYHQEICRKQTDHEPTTRTEPMEVDLTGNQ